ncbi:hypothetical protein AGOR_G00187440 [Albula goreensis]|uniref:Kinesin-like protein n=1 Tax=Albula goreensis TaxID=1534307 RepID=A0A8T3CX57_9TELE|nr:hypothetical protein AGOR_G00187440 [Albula goreensis]
MNSSIVELLTIGLSIKISRSDGRVHAANVKAVHPEKGAVFVEWQENSATKGKEVEINELCNLNRELFEYLKSSSQPDPVPSQPNNFHTRLRSSRIPAPSEANRKSVVRRTCVRPPVAAAAVSEGPEPGSCQNGMGVFKPAGKRGFMKTVPMACVTEDTMETEATAVLRTGSAISSAKRRSLGSEAEKMHSRETVRLKNVEMQAKRGKDGISNRPHWQFYKMIEEYRETLEITPISTSDPIEDHRICVCVRKRPLSKQEVAKKEIDVVSVPGRGSLLLHAPKHKVDLTKYLDNQLFKFDYSFDETSTNDIVYRFTAQPLVKSVFEGGMATCFAYGQTGSGKTHTMGGDYSGKKQNSSNGIYALAAEDVFRLLKDRKYSSMGLLPFVTFFEIYNGKVFDLLNKRSKLRVLEDGKQQVQVVGLQETYVSSASDVIKLIEMGSACRTSGQTFANSNSSRSHAVLQVILRQKSRLHGKFSLVDLAGNERGTDVSSNDRQIFMETSEINRSLLALKECIRSLGKNSDHIPFRMSKLTQVLRDSFIGENSRTCMIAMVSPGMGSCDYTLNTLRYADRVKELNGAMGGNESDSDKRAEMEVDEESLSEDDSSSPVCSLYEVMSQVSEAEERVCEVLQGGSDIANSMQQPGYSTAAVRAEIMGHMRRLADSFQAWEAALRKEELERKKDQL